MRRFEYKGTMLTIRELVEFSVVPYQVLRSRLTAGQALWEVNSALTTPFGEKGKISEASKNDIDSWNDKRKRLAKAKNN